MTRFRVRRAATLLVASPLSLAVALAASIHGAPIVSAVTSNTISSNPLSVTISNDLNCQVAHSGDTSFEWYPPAQPVTGDCGTYLWLPSLNGGQLFGPATGHARTFTPTAWVPVSQNLVGTTITTVVETGTASDPNCGLTLTQVDAYTPGQERYRTTIDITIDDDCTPPSPSPVVSPSPSPPPPPAFGAKRGATSRGTSVASPSNILYRAGDCYLQNSDSGFGITAPAQGPTGSVYCRSSVSGQPGPRIEGFEPVTAGSHYVEDGFATVWNDIALRTQFPDTCQCNTDIDNGAGISWGENAEATHFVSDTVFSPTALAPSPSPSAAVAPATAPALPKAGETGQTAVNWPILLIGVLVATALAAAGVRRLRHSS